MAQDEKDWIFVSDAHFTGNEADKMETFLQFLEREKNRMAKLILLGDLFEFFFGFKNLFPREKPSPFSSYLPILEMLKELYEQGIEIEYFEGNHDFFLSSFFKEQFLMDIPIHPNGCEQRIGGKRAFLAHGDLSNPGQWRYRLFRRLLKNRLTYHLIHWIGPDLSLRVAQTMSQASYQKYHQSSSTPPPAFKEFAHQKFLEGFDLVVLGHSHYPEKYEELVRGRRCLYFNVGDWMSHRSYLRFTPPDQFELERWGNPSLKGGII